MSFLIINSSINIAGTGFTTKDRTSVMIGFAQCDIQSMNFSQITCITAPSAVWSGDIKVDTLTLQNEILTAECEGDCSYSYSGLSTPLVYSVSPATVSLNLSHFQVYQDSTSYQFV